MENFIFYFFLFWQYNLECSKHASHKIGQIFTQWTVQMKTGRPSKHTVLTIGMLQVILTFLASNDENDLKSFQGKFLLQTTVTTIYKELK